MHILKLTELAPFSPKSSGLIIILVLVSQGSISPLSSKRGFWRKNLGEIDQILKYLLSNNVFTSFLEHRNLSIWFFPSFWMAQIAATWTVGLQDGDGSFYCVAVRF